MQTKETATAPVEIVGAFLNEAPVNLLGIIQALGLKFEKSATLSPDVSGKIERNKDGYLITVNGHDGTLRQRFTTAHEIAHYVLHKDLIGDAIIDNALYRSASLSNEIESQANRYAADILMPAAVVRRYFREGRRSLAELSSIFQVSSEAVRIRLNSLGFGA